MGPICRRGIAIAPIPAGAIMMLINWQLLHPMNIIIILLIVAIGGMGLALITTPHMAPQ
jgi:hypothetical protein